MSAPFTINFRREAFRREVAHARRRVILLGVWLTYFGVLAVILGLYGLNCTSLALHAARIDRQAARMRTLKNPQDWTVGADELVTAEHFYANPRRWHDKMARLAALLPPNAVIQSVAVNPDNLPGIEEQHKLVISGEFKVPAGQDRMRGVVQLVSALHADSVFASGYRNIVLAQSQAAEYSGSVVSFQIECR